MSSGRLTDRWSWQRGPVEHEAWVMAVLVAELHMAAEQIGQLSEEEARRLVEEHWSKPT